MTNLEIIEMQKISDKPNPAPVFSVGTGAGSGSPSEVKPVNGAKTEFSTHLQLHQEGYALLQRWNPSFFMAEPGEEDSRNNGSEFGSLKVRGSIDEHVKKKWRVLMKHFQS